MTKELENEVAVFSEFGINRTLSHLMKFVSKEALGARYSDEEIERIIRSYRREDFSSDYLINEKTNGEAYIYGDARENITRAVIDMILDKKNYIEISNVDDSLIDECFVEADSFVRNQCNPIRISLSHFHNTKQICDALRDIISDLETNEQYYDKQMSEGDDGSHHTGTLFKFERACKHIWQSYGVVVELDKNRKPFVARKKCVEKVCDGTGGPDGRSLRILHRTTECKYQHIWPDPNNPNAKPPASVLPPIFNGAPWSGDIPLYADETGTVLTSRFGIRQHPPGYLDFHEGIDVKHPGGEGTPVLSLPIKGTIAKFMNPSNEINSGIQIKYGNYLFMYIHLDVDSANLPAVGAEIGASVAIGTLKKWAGGTPSPHVHLQVYDVNTKKYVDPVAAYRILSNDKLM